MGTDVNAHSGVLVRADTLVRGLITSKRKIKKLKKKLEKEKLSKVLIIDQDDEPDNVVDVITSYLEEQVSSEQERYADAYIEDEEIVQDILQCIIDSCSTKALPPIEYLQAFGNYRTTGLMGLGCELDTIYAVFDEGYCFISMVSEAGANLQRISHKLDVTHWTSVSY